MISDIKKAAKTILRINPKSRNGIAPGLKPLEIARGIVREIDFADLDFGQKLGEGAFGTVHIAVWKGQKVAVKRLNHVGTGRWLMQEVSKGKFYIYSIMR